MARVGFIGLGLMGSHMARNLVRAGHELTVHSRSPAPVDALVAEGAARASSPAEVASGTEVIITMLPDTPDVELVLFGPDGVAETVAGGSLVIDMSTIDPIATRRFAERMAERGVGMLDAPVSGGDIGARDATLSIMIGGTEADVARAQPLFEAMGKNIVHVGASGAGQIAKACNQLVLAGTLEAVGEALVLAAKAGVDPAKVREALLGGFAASRVLEVHGQRMLDGNFAPGFRAELMYKDARRWWPPRTSSACRSPRSSASRPSSRVSSVIAAATSTIRPSSRCGRMTPASMCAARTSRRTRRGASRRCGDATARRSAGPSRGVAGRSPCGTPCAG